MAKKPKNAPAPPAPSTKTALPPTPLIPPTKEEVNRLHVESVLRTQLQNRHDELGALIGKDLKKSDILRTLCATGEAIMANVLHAQGRLRAATGQTDAFVEAKRADFCARARKSVKLLEGDHVENTAYEEVVEAMKPGLESLQRLVKDLDVPGVKIAITPSGAPGQLLDEEGSPTPAAAAWPKDQPEPVAAPKAEAAPAPVEVPRGPVGAIGMNEGPVIDVVPESYPVHPLDGLDDFEVEGVVNDLFDDFKEIGVTGNKLKRKDWKEAREAWFKIWPEGCDLTVTRKVYDLLQFACHERTPFSWAVATEKDLIDHQRKLALQDPSFDLEKEA